MQSLISPGVAADTAKVRNKLASKFPVRSVPIFIAGGQLPQPAGAEVGDFVNQVQAFDASAGAGPTGLRPQFIKELVGEERNMGNRRTCSLELWVRVGSSTLLPVQPNQTSFSKSEQEAPPSVS